MALEQVISERMAIKLPGFQLPQLLEFVSKDGVTAAQRGQPRLPLFGPRLCRSA